MYEFKIHYEINDYHDYFIIQGETIEEVKINVKIEADKRELDPVKNNIWSEEIK